MHADRRNTSLSHNILSNPRRFRSCRGCGRRSRTWVKWGVVLLGMKVLLVDLIFKYSDVSVRDFKNETVVPPWKLAREKLYRLLEQQKQTDASDTNVIRQDANRSALQQVNRWEKYKRSIKKATIRRKSNITHAYLNVTQPPWKELKGMLLDHSLRMPDSTKSYFRRLQSRANQFDYPFRFVPRDLCTDRTKFVVLIHSRADYQDVRLDLRDTWVGDVTRGRWPGHPPLPEIKVVFMVAEYSDAVVMETLKTEAAQFNDIVLCGFKDSYYNMTIKSMMGLRFVMEECPKVKYMIKIDDDVIINWPYLLTTLYALPKTRLMLGPINPGSKVSRDGGKWAVPRNIYPFEKYPPYLSGACYVISVDVVTSLVAVAPFVPAFHVDDAYVTGVLAKVIGVKPKGKKGFAYWGSPKPTGCLIYQNKIITGTKVTEIYRTKLWSDIKQIAAGKIKCY